MVEKGFEEIECPDCGRRIVIESQEDELLRGLLKEWLELHSPDATLRSAAWLTHCAVLLKRTREALK
jgi:hypothetical protein